MHSGSGVRQFIVDSWQQQLNTDTLNGVDNLELVLSKQGKYEEVEAMHRRALETGEKVLGTDTLTSMANLTFTFKSQNRDHELSH